MDERARAIIEAAFATVECSEAQRESVMVDIAQREANEPYEKPRWRGNSKSARSDAFDDQGLIYKTTEQPEPRATAMDPATIQKQFEDLVSIIGAEVGQREKQLLTQFNAEIKRLDDKIAELQTEIRASNAKNVTPLRSARDVA
jgi:hypothetical protein